MQLFILIFIFLFGLVIGSFLNCLIWRLHKGEKITGRSYCPNCRKKIAWYNNIPLLSFLLLRGKCRCCNKSISWQYPAVEFIAGVLFVVSFLVEFGIWNQEFGYWGAVINQIPNSQFLITVIRDWFIIAVMIVIFVYDLRWYLILDIVTLPACAVVFIFNIILGFDWLNLLISGIMGGSFFLFQFVVSRGKWIGGGDIRLGLLMGLILGWPNILAGLFLAYFIGSIVGIGLIIKGKKGFKSKLPLGVFLSTATIVILFWGTRIINWYISISMFNFLY